MPRNWTDEQRAAARERAKAQGFGKASVEEHELPSVDHSEVFIAEHQSRVESTVDVDQDEDGNPVKTTHTRPGTLIMYKPTERQGYVPRRVAVTSIALLLKQGWAENCPECGKKHIDKRGLESTDPNLCSARPPVAVILCPVCRQRIYDNLHFDEVPEMEDDENVITPDDLRQSTPEERLIAARNLHLWTNHPRSAQERNIPPLPTALRDMVGGGQAG